MCERKMLNMLEMIAFDADDTLWHNENNYRKSERDLCELLKNYAGCEEVMKYLLERENTNIPYYGYGVKSFTFSMIETAIDLSDGEIKSREVQKIIGFARRMLDFEVTLLEGVREVVQQLSKSFPLLVITKGDLLDQQIKLRRSGLEDYLPAYEVVSNKDTETYARLFERYLVNPQKVLMVGNSLKSDVLPVVELGGYGVFIPYHTTWEHERLDHNPHEKNERFFELETIRELPGLIMKLNGN